MSPNVLFRALLTFIIGFTCVIQSAVAQAEQNEFCRAALLRTLSRSSGLNPTSFLTPTMTLIGTSTNSRVKIPNEAFERFEAEFVRFFKLAVRWGDFGYQTGCRDKQAFGVGGSECERKLNTVAGSCPSRGMGYPSEIAENGCVLWKVEG
ncbi:hypothetical protein AC579_9192 [Pseudocercospora musae]|uniref:Uncharacterized protein n=1 Tax=Pseudocercospora musae TaxID=113226 RepID=A0A139HAT5_9PEZI|nr:hypothetical protein AC579_9192 [Pseudocercospora musae]